MRTSPALLLALLVTASRVPAADDVVTARLSARGREAVVEATIAPGWHVNAHAPRDEFLIPTTVALTAPPGVRAGEVRYPLPVERRLAFGGDTSFLLYEGTVRFTAPLDGEPVQGGPPLRAAFRFQACNDARCLPPRTLELEVGLDAAGAAGAGTLAASDRIAGSVARFGWPVTLLWVALLGVALNLTPCVYPLISITIAFFGGRTAGHEARAVRRALFYVLGICLSFSALGVAAALTGSLFGAALQRPVVLGAIAAVLVALAASNFGLWQLRVPSPVLQRLGRVGEGNVGALAMGLTMGVVAAPCIGPVVVALVLYVGAHQSTPLGFALFFTLGVGMGMPYLGLAALARRIRTLPRAGAWLAWVERVFGFLLLGLALWFVAPLLPDAWLHAATMLLLVAAGLVLGFLGPETPPPMRWPRRAGGLALLAVALAGLLGAETGARPAIAWAPFSDDALASALGAGRPVLIDFEAAWCLPCREMDRTTFRDTAVVRAAAAFAAFKVDLTADDASAEAIRQRFAIVGVPTLIVLGRDGHERRRFERFVPVDDMLAAMEAVVPRG